MSTYANILIEGREFNVRSDGQDKDTIRACVREYVEQARVYTKPGYLATTVVDAIVSESAGDYYAPFALGYCELPSYNWTIHIGQRGGVEIRGGRVKL